MAGRQPNCRPANARGRSGGGRTSYVAPGAKKDNAMNVNKSDRWTKWPARLAGAALTVALVASGLPGGTDVAAARKRASPKLVQQFANTSSITINGFQQTLPTEIVVSGFTTEVADVDVTLSNFTHGDPNDVDFLLVGPGGQAALVVSDIGSSATNVTLTLDDNAANQVPSSGPLPSGTFQPTNFSTVVDTFTPPAPAKPSNSKLGVFNSTDPNGVWSLHIKNSSNGTGALNGGWSLKITSANGVPNASPDNFQAQAGKPLSEPPFGVLANDTDPDNDNLTATLASKPKKGTLQLEANGAFIYRPNKKAKGTDSFTYLAQDPGGLSDLETVTIQIAKAKKKRKK
jgi:hypothetical protein